jgi:cytosine/adenosine deaminase-related metal-dependent hydrolase
MIVRARVVVTMDGPPIENGAVVISGERTVDVGKFPDVAGKYSRENIVDLGEQTLLPGLINLHCHLDYTCLRGKIPPQRSFTDWIRAINAEKAKLSHEDYVASINQGFAEAKRFGTTTIANLTVIPELISRIEAPIRTWWFGELIDLRNPSRANQIVDRAVGQLKPQERWGLAPHALFTASPDLYRSCAAIAPFLTTHLAESCEELSMFRDARGELFEFMREIGRDMSDCGRGTPLEEFLGRSRAIEVSRPYLLVHLNELADGDFDLLSRAALEFSIVHCPRSHEYLAHSPFQFEGVRKRRFDLCLGTDSLASNEDLSLFAEMRAFQREFPNISADEIFKMVTVNAARALRQQNALGKIAAGFLTDVIALPLERSKSIFEEVIAFDGPVDWLMVGGRISA